MENAKIEQNKNSETYFAACQLSESLQDVESCLKILFEAVKKASVKSESFKDICQENIS